MFAGRLRRRLWEGVIGGFCVFLGVDLSYSPYRHLGTARRCGAVRSEAVVRSQRSWRRALARRPKHHSGLEVDVLMSCIRHAAPTGGWISRGEVLICTTDE